MRAIIVLFGVFALSSNGQCFAQTSDRKEELRNRIVELVARTADRPSQPVMIELETWEDLQPDPTFSSASPGRSHGPDESSRVRVWFGESGWRENIDLPDNGTPTAKILDSVLRNRSSWRRVGSGVEVQPRGSIPQMGQLKSSSARSVLAHLSGGLSWISPNFPESEWEVRLIERNFWEASTSVELGTPRREFTVRLTGQWGSAHEHEWMRSVELFKSGSTQASMTISLGGWSVDTEGRRTVELVKMRTPEAQVVQRALTIEHVTLAELERVLEPPSKDGIDAVRPQFRPDAYEVLDQSSAEPAVLSAGTPAVPASRERQASKMYNWTWLTIGSAASVLLLFILIRRWTN